MIRHAQRPRWQLAVLWSFSMLLSPLLLAQGLRVRRTALRMPDGEPPNEGCYGEGEPLLRIVGLGDSVIAGVGVKTMSESLTAQVAKRYHETSGDAVSWIAEGTNGDKLSDLIKRLGRLPRADIFLVSLGVNDVTSLTGLLRWQLQITELISLLGKVRHASVVLLGVPPMEFFHALPQPLRWVLGIRAALLDKTLQQVSSLLRQVTHIDSSIMFDADHLAEDGYHPNTLACMEISAEIVDALPLEAVKQSVRQSVIPGSEQKDYR